MKNITLILLLALSFFSCEYDSDNVSYKNLENPKDIQIGIDLAGVQPNDTIYIYANTQLYYFIDTQGKQILNQEFIIDGAVVSSAGNSLYISQVNLDNKAHKLKVKTELKTNTGSLAEILGAEKYVGEVSYNLKFIKGVDPRLNIRQEITKDGYLKILWDKPDMKQTFVEKYEISYYDNLSLSWVTKTINSENETYFLDKDYAYGVKTFRITTFFVDNRISAWEDYYTVKYDAITEDDIKLEELSKDKVKLSWAKPPFNCKFVLKWVDNTVTYLATKETSVEVSVPKFPEYRAYRLYVLPAEADSKNYEKYQEISFIYRTPSFDNYPFSLTYNSKQNVFYGLGFYGGNSNVYKYDGSSINLLQTIKVSDLHTGNKIVTSSKTNKIAYSNIMGYINIISNNNFNNPLVVKNDYSDEVYLSDNDILISGYYAYSTPPYFNIVDANTGKSKYQIVGTEGGYNFSLSLDGKYLSYRKYDWAGITELKVYALKDTSAELIYTEDMGQSLFKLTFNPINSDQLFIVMNNEFYVLDVVSKKKSAKIKGDFQMIDPATGNVLYKDADYVHSDDYKVHILNNKLDKILLTQSINNINPFADIYLMNNFLIMDSAYRNLSNYLKQ